MKSWRAMHEEWRRLMERYDDPRSTLTDYEFVCGAMYALTWAYSPRATRPSTLNRIRDLPDAERTPHARP